ncbi:5963_t:CDS:2, partial [Funneliformis mosseae]
FKCTFYIMDLQYDALYRMIQLGVFYLPRDRHDFSVINDALEVLLHAQLSLNRKLMKRHSFHTPMKVSPQSWEALTHLEDQFKSPSDFEIILALRKAQDKWGTKVNAVNSSQ